MLKAFKYLIFLLLGFTSIVKAEQTLSMIKPDAVANGHIGAIIADIESAGLKIVKLKMMQLTPDQATQFYHTHQEKFFFGELIDFMTSGPIVVQVLESDNAIKEYRDLMGDTDPSKASPNTLRAKFATSKGKNAVHGSDSPIAAKQEIAFFFGSS